MSSEHVPVNTPRVALRGEVELVRESLEGIFEPTVATSVLFTALSTWGKGVPENADEVLELVRGPLKDLLYERLGGRAEGALERLEEQLLQIAASDVGLEVELDLEGDEAEEAMTAQMLSVNEPVSVLILAADPRFGERLTASIGFERVHAFTVTSVAELRHATFSANPLIVVVDAARPPAEPPPDVANAIRALPDATLAVVWGEETSYGREVRVRIEQGGADALFLDRVEGIGPLLDLVLSRYEPDSIPPPKI